MTRRRPVEERFWPKVDQHGPVPLERPDLGSCWLWTAAVTTTKYGAYGTFYNGSTMVSAHRMAYVLVVGPIPEGLELDHLCRNPFCVRPSHLEPVTHAENMARSAKATASHCRRGHPFDDSNTYVTSAGRRRCKTCERFRQMSRRSIAA